jgi:integrase
MNVHSIVLWTFMPGGSVPAQETGVAGYIASWRPSSATGPAAGFARDVVTRAGPRDQGRAKNLLWASAKLADYAISLGLEPVPQVLLHPSVTERFAASAPGLSGAARRTLRTNLRFLARKVVPGLGPAPAALPRERAKAPYSAGQIAGYLALADAQPTLARRMRASGLVCLGAGAGLTGADLRGVRGTDITCRSGGVLVDVGGRRPRAVPVLAGYHDPLLASAKFAGDRLITGGRDPGRNNVTTPLICSLAGGTGLPHLEASRLRATWLADCAALLGLATFMAAAGITCSQRLGDIIATLEPGGEAEAVALLGGTR